MTPAQRSYAILPAAGRSRRLGQPKLLLPWGDRPLIEHILETWLRSAVTTVVVVAHPDDAELHEIVRRSGAEVVAPTDPPDDMQESLSVGIRYVAKRLAPQPEDVWLAAPADLPFLTPDLIDALLNASKQTDAPILAPRAGGRRGHPLLLRWPLAEELLLLPQGAGLHTLTRREAPYEVDWPDERIHLDIDTREDYQRGLDSRDA